MNSPNQYEKRLVGFLDLLGFKDLISRFTEEPKLFDWTLGILKAIKSQEKIVYGFSEDLNVQMEFTTFSDSIILSSRIPEDPINMALFQIAFTCSLFLRHGLFARGAIVENYLYHKENIIIGQGLVEAYKSKIKDIEQWLSDDNADIVEFAKGYTAYLKNAIKYENARVDKEFDLMKSEFDRTKKI